MCSWFLPGFWLGLVEGSRVITIAIKYQKGGSVGGGGEQGKSSPDSVMTNPHCQPHCIQNHLGDTPVGMSVLQKLN